jgi:hypothetical protein
MSMTVSRQYSYLAYELADKGTAYQQQWEEACDLSAIVWWQIDNQLAEYLQQ